MYSPSGAEVVASQLTVCSHLRAVSVTIPTPTPAPAPAPAPPLSPPASVRTTDYAQQDVVFNDVVGDLAKWEEECVPRIEIDQVRCSRLLLTSDILLFAHILLFASKSPGRRALSLRPLLGEVDSRDHAAERGAHRRRVRVRTPGGRADVLQTVALRELSFMYRYISRESCSQFDSLPLTSLTISGGAQCGADLPRRERRR
jgi:hypothetical protein